MAVRLFAIIFILTSVPSHAMGVGSLCEHLKAPACEESPPWYISPLVGACKSQLKDLKCTELVQKFEIPAGQRRECTPYTQCREVLSPPSLVGVCWQAIHDQAESLGEFAAMLTLAVTKELDLRKKFLRDCDEDATLNCKRNLAQEVPHLQGLSDAELKGLKSSIIWNEWNSHQNARQIAREYTDKRTVRLYDQEPPQGDVGQIKWSSIKEWMAEKYDAYQCLNQEAQMVLACHALLATSAPFAAEKLLKSSPWIARLRDRRGRAVPEVTSGLRGPARRRLITQYEKWDASTPEANRSWIKMAEEGKRPDRSYLNVENARIKSLNDDIKDKSLVTALTNKHKQLALNEIHGVLKNHPELKATVYSDFKSLRLALDGPLDSDVRQKLERALRYAELKFLNDPDVRASVRAQDFEEAWFVAGWGETADESLSASRVARGLGKSIKPIMGYDSPEVKKILGQSLSESKALEREVSQSLPIDNGALNGKLFELARKNTTDQQLENELKAHFGLKSLPSGMGTKIRSYVSRVDQFSPGLFIDERKVATFTNAPHGGLSVDFVGMGGKNLEATARALRQAESVDEALVLARKAEREVTKAFTEQKNNVESLIGGTAGSRAKIQSICSGDDCVGIPSAPLTSAEKASFVSNLAQQGNPANYRVAFVSKDVRQPEARGVMISHGESLEKILRQNLMGKMEPRRLEGLLFATDMKGGAPGSGPISVYMGRSPTLKLSAEEKRTLASSLKESLHQLNGDLRKLGVESNYTLDDMRFVAD